MDYYGDFIVAYTRDTNNNNPDVFAKDYYANGTLRNVITVAASAAAESNPSIAMDASGDFDIAYQSQFGTNKAPVGGPAYIVYVNQYSRVQGDKLLRIASVTAGSASDDLPSIAMDAGGDAVVAYHQRFSQ